MVRLVKFLIFNPMNKPSKAILFIGSLIIFSCALQLFSKIKKSDDSTNSSAHLRDKISLPLTLLDTNGNEVSTDRLKGKYVGLYFSASWCGPCRSFTPKLVKFKEEHKENFEVVLISSDGSSKAQANYMKKYKMPWFALKNQSDVARNISLSLQVEFIPYLVILDADGHVITKAGKKDIDSMGNAAFASWTKS